MELTLEEIEIQKLFLSLPSDSLLTEAKTKDQFRFWHELKRQNYLLYAFYLREVLTSRFLRTAEKTELKKEIKIKICEIDKEINKIIADKYARKITEKEFEYFNELWLLVNLLYKLFKEEVTTHRNDEFPASPLILFNEIVTVELNNRFRLVLKDKFEHSQGKHNNMLKLAIKHLDERIKNIDGDKVNSKLSKIENMNYWRTFKNYRIVRSDSKYSNPSLEILYSLAMRELSRNKDIRNSFRKILENIIEQHELRNTLGEARKPGTRERLMLSALWVNGVKT
jgi:hypothetical protein